eukprot:m.119869 g.119869  ORF g.119869 m.119869 type:complete len:133 (+) comp21821_c0_seq2:1043-1441(+)
MATPLIQEYALRYGGFADFAYVYIEEAHAADEWPLGAFERHAQPRTIEQRVELARRFARVYSRPTCEGVGPIIPVCVDTIDNAFGEAFAVWPERFFVIRGGTVTFISQPCNEFGFDRSELEAVLNDCAASAQ